MNISFTKDEYALLLEAVTMMTNVAGDYENTEEETWGEQAFALEQKLLTRAADFGCADLAEYDTDVNTWLPCRDAFEDTISGILTERDDDQDFWDTLAMNLAMRDMQEELTPDEWSLFPEDEIITQRLQRMQGYLDLFEESGLENLRLIPSSFTPKSPPLN